MGILDLSSQHFSCNRLKCSGSQRCKNAISGTTGARKEFYTSNESIFPKIWNSALSFCIYSTQLHKSFKNLQNLEILMWLFQGVSWVLGPVLCACKGGTSRGYKWMGHKGCGLITTWKKSIKTLKITNHFALDCKFTKNRILFRH